MANKKKASDKWREELLQQDINSESRRTAILFYPNAFIVSLIPIWIYWRIHLMDIPTSIFAYIVVTSVNTWLLVYSYKRTKLIIIRRIAGKRKKTIEQDILTKYKKCNKKQRNIRILWKVKEVADFEATTFAIFFTNASFLVLVIFLSFFIFNKFPTLNNYIHSVGFSGEIVALISKGRQFC